MAYVNGFIFVGSPWQRARTRGVVIAEKDSRVEPRYAPKAPAGPPYNLTAVTAAEEQCIDLAWTNGTPSPAETEVWESADGLAYSLLSLLAGDGANPDGLLPLTKSSLKRNVGLFDVQRFYQLRHVNATDFSAFSAVVSARSQKDYPDAPPVALTATVRARPNGETQLDLNWTNGDVTASTEVYRGGALLATTAPGVSTLAVTGLTANTAYTFSVRHTKSGIPSVSSNTATVTTLVDGPDADPYNPSSTGGTGVAGQGLVTVGWINGDATAQTEIWVSSDNGVTFGLLITMAAGATGYMDNTGVYNQLRYYKFRHTKGGVVSGFSGTTSAYSGQDIPDAAPSGLVVTTPAAPGGATSLALSWTNGDSTCVTEVLRAGTTVATVGAGFTNYTDTGLLDATTYSYSLRHLKNGVYSPNSNTASGTTIDAPDAPPSSLGAVQGTGRAGQGKINLSWVNGDAAATTRILVGAASGAESTQVIDVAAGVTTYIHDVGAFNVTRWYVVLHVKNSCLSATSNEASAPSGLDIPDADPAGLSATPTARPGGETQLALAWTNGDSSCQTNIYRAGALVTTVAAGATAFTDTGLAINGTYAYEVRHIKSGVESGGTTCNGTTLVDGPDAAPSGVNAVYNGNATNTLSWVNGDATASTEIYTNGALTTIVAPGVTSYSYPSTANTSYTHICRHNKNGYVSDWSNLMTLTTPVGPRAATGFTVTPTARPGGETQLALNWTPQDTDYGPELYRNGVFVSTLAAGQGSLQDAGRTPNTAYTYTLRYVKNGFAVVTVASGTTLVDGPDAAPSNLQGQSIGGGSVNWHWTLGDVTASSEMWAWSSVSDPGTLMQTIAPGTSNTVMTPGAYRTGVRHVKNGIYSAFATT